MSHALTLITPPAALPVDVATLKAHLKIDDAAEDALLELYLAAAVGLVDGRDGVLKRCLVTQTWELALDAFGPVIEIPLSPLIAVESIAYDDAEGVEIALEADAYVVDAGRVPGRVTAIAAFPEARRVAGSVRIRFTAGYGGADAVPQPIKAAILLTAARIYRQRGDAPEGADALPAAASALLNPFRIWTLG